MIKTVIALIFAFGMGFSSCHRNEDASDLVGMKWVLRTLDGDTVVMQEEKNRAYIQFDTVENRVVGMSGCNHFFGDYETDGRKLKFMRVGATLRACPDSQVESAFMRVLNEADACEVKDTRLTLFSKDQPLAVFQGEPLSQAAKQ